MRISFVSAALLALLARVPAAAQQPGQPYVTVAVVPDHPGWTYHVGERARFAVSILRAGHPAAATAVTYELGPDLMDARATGPLALRGGRAEVDGGTMREPGFLRLTVKATVEGHEYTGVGTAGFDPERIQPYATPPADFEAYWRESIRRAREVPLQPVMTPVPGQSTAEVAVYHVSFQVDRAESRFYGMLSVPTRPGKYPAILEVPGAGVRPYRANVWTAQRGAIHLAVGIHGIPVNMGPSVYDALRNGALNGYWLYGLEDRDRYYYHRVILGAIRAGDFIATLPQWDGRGYGVYGSSQGGALSIITAALDPRVRALAAIHPALSDHEAFLHGRAGGWPHLFAKWNGPNTPERINTARYYDVANFARLVRVPGWYSWGYNDTVVPPTSTYAAYNVITAPKQLLPLPETAHWTYPEQWNAMTEFVFTHVQATP